MAGKIHWVNTSAKWKKGQIVDIPFATVGGVRRLKGKVLGLDERKPGGRRVYQVQEVEQNPSSSLPRNKWVKGQIRVTSAGKIQFRKV